MLGRAHTAAKCPLRHFCFAASTRRDLGSARLEGFRYGSIPPHCGARDCRLCSRVCRQEITRRSRSMPDREHSAPLHANDNSEGQTSLCHPGNSSAGHGHHLQKLEAASRLTFFFPCFFGPSIHPRRRPCIRINFLSAAFAYSLLAYGVSSTKPVGFCSHLTTTTEH